jgi:fido (protein-threonine AMPylation protein)
MEILNLIIFWIVKIISWVVKHGNNFLTGFLASGLASSIFFIIQMKRDKKNHEEFALQLCNISNQGLDTKDTIAQMKNTLDQKLAPLPPDKKLNMVDNEYKQTETLLKKSYKKCDSNFVEAALKYKVIADTRANIAINLDDFSIVANDGTINIENILNAHIAMFPEGYAFAGKLRSTKVEIMGLFNSSGRSIDPILSSYRVNVLPVNQIRDKFAKLVRRWNQNVKLIRNDDLRSISAELAHFHHDFLLIHPFLDGNGRIARLISNEQASYLLNKKVRFTFDINLAEYYRALHLVDQREIEPLQKIIYDQLLKCTKQS